MTIQKHAQVIVVTVSTMVGLIAASVMAGNHQHDTSLKGPDAFEHLSGEAFSRAVFTELGKVITHPRCVNCHAAHDMPLQGDDMVPHQPPVHRGEFDMGKPGMYCTTCHAGDNAKVSKDWSMPGHAPWKMAPASQVWQDKSLREICEQLKDPERAHMTLEEVVTHFAEDGLVGWGWHPGEGRSKAPGDQKTTGELARAWVDSGAHCPAD